MQTIIGQFDGPSRAQGAVQALLEHNYDRADISFVANDLASDTALGEQSGPATAGGAALGLLVGLGSLVVPGVGPILAAGPFAVGLAGAAAGVAQKDAHWLSGALGKDHVPDAAARGYGEFVGAGGALVIMGAREEVAENITAILRDSGAVAIKFHPRDEGSSGA
jgi:hypothetical protein